ncbi:MAG: hypothetical protein JSV52_13730 [Candidatus Zixiibacteriota bacterium]|nr:MAG: hypothetical protein JSV52_13730 [candidate division Zixibacteria bacterium]
MDKTNDHMANIEHIRSIMEKSTTFMSLTGLSGVMAGLYAMLAFALVTLKLNSLLLREDVLRRITAENGLQVFMAVVLAGALALTLLTALALTIRKARKKGQPISDGVSKRFAVHLFLPLVAGGLFVLALAYHGQLGMVSSAMLLFFGLALINSGRFVLMDMFWLGTVEIILGLAAAFWPSLGLVLWLIGFGLATIAYGTLMYFKYER